MVQPKAFFSADPVAMFKATLFRTWEAKDSMYHAGVLEKEDGPEVIKAVVLRAMDQRPR